MIAAITIVMVVWIGWLRGRGERPATAERSGAGLAHARSASSPQPASDAPTSAPEWVADRDPDGPLRLEGQVLGTDGRGVAGATVWLGSIPPRTTTTDDDGSFAFDRLVARLYVVAAASDDLIGGPVSYQLTSDSDPVVIRMAAGAAVAVTVLDERGRPVEAADVRIRGLARRTVKTTASGTAKLAPIQPGWILVEVSAPGFAPASAVTTAGSPGTVAELTITLRAGVVVSGRVIDEDGKPVAGAHVTAGGNVAWGPVPDAASAQSGADGRFSIPALAPGTYTLVAIDGEHAPARSSPIDVAGRAVDNVTIAMQAGGVITGSVIDRDRKPHPFATVHVIDPDRRSSQAVRRASTDQAGRFELRGLARKRLAIRAESGSAASQIVEIDLASRPAELQLVLDVAGTIAGTVVDDNGAPVPEITVLASPQTTSGASVDAVLGLTAATTDGGGGFVLRGLADGAYRLVAVRETGGFQDRGRGTLARTGDAGVRITLPAPGELVGKLALSGSSRPPAVATVMVGYQVPTTARDGAFHISNLPPGRYDVTFRGPEFGELVRHDVAIESARTTDLGTITVTHGRRLIGLVVDKEGAPVADAKIRVGESLISAAAPNATRDAFEELAGIRSAVSDRNGAFTVIGIPTKATTAIAEHPQLGRSVAIAVPEGVDDPPPVTLALRSFGTIVGKVTRKGQPVPDVVVMETIKGGGPQSTFTRTGADGSYTLPNVPEGTHLVSARQQAMKSTTVTVDVTPGARSTADIEIPVGQITVIVQIKALPNHRVDGAQVFLFAGDVAITNGKQLLDSLQQLALRGNRAWLGAGKPWPKFEEIEPGDHSICTVPITGDLEDPVLEQRMDEHSQSLRVYCKTVHVEAAPSEQTFVHAVPSMAPLPAD